MKKINLNTENTLKVLSAVILAAKGLEEIIKLFAKDKKKK